MKEAQELLSTAVANLGGQATTKLLDMAVTKPGLFYHIQETHMYPFALRMLKTNTHTNQRVIAAILHDLVLKPYGRFSAEEVTMYSASRELINTGLSSTDINLTKDYILATPALARPEKEHLAYFKDHDLYNLSTTYTIAYNDAVNLALEGITKENMSKLYSIWLTDGIYTSSFKDETINGQTNEFRALCIVSELYSNIDDIFVEAQERRIQLLRKVS